MHTASDLGEKAERGTCFGGGGGHDPIVKIYGLSLGVKEKVM